MEWELTQIARYAGPDGLDLLAVLEGDELIEIGPAPERGFIPSPEAWVRIEEVERGRRLPVDEATFRPPLDPPQILCIGLNYRDHASEADESVPEAPLVFAKLPSSVIGHGETIVVPPQESQPDWEAELALVIGREGRDLTPEQATEVIGGYTAFNDVSGRQSQFSDGQWTRGKSFDTFGPLGPTIHSPEGVDWADIPVSCVVSGDRRQHATTADLVFDVPTLLSYLSAQFVLSPGDVIATGTPSGVGLGMESQRWLEDGDIVEVTVGAVGPLRNPVRRA